MAGEDGDDDDGPYITVLYPNEALATPDPKATERKRAVLKRSSTGTGSFSSIAEIIAPEGDADGAPVEDPSLTQRTLSRSPSSARIKGLERSSSSARLDALKGALGATSGPSTSGEEIERLHARLDCVSDDLHAKLDCVSDDLHEKLRAQDEKLERIMELLSKR